MSTESEVVNNLKDTHSKFWLVMHLHEYFGTQKVTPKKLKEEMESASVNFRDKYKSVKNISPGTIKNWYDKTIKARSQSYLEEFFGESIDKSNLFTAMIAIHQILSSRFPEKFGEKSGTIAMERFMVMDKEELFTILGLDGSYIAHMNGEYIPMNDLVRRSWEERTKSFMKGKFFLYRLNPQSTGNHDFAYRVFCSVHHIGKTVVYEDYWKNTQGNEKKEVFRYKGKIYYGGANLIILGQRENVAADAQEYFWASIKSPKQFPIKDPLPGVCTGFEEGKMQVYKLAMTKVESEEYEDFLNSNRYFVSRSEIGHIENFLLFNQTEIGAHVLSPL